MRKRKTHPAWTLEEKSRNVHQLRLNISGGDWSQYVLVVSDLHWDNPHCDRRLLKRHFDQAVERNAPILMLGDVLCIMQGRGDPRRSKDEIRPEHNEGSYLDAVVSTAVDWFEPYKDYIALYAIGNHETKIVKHQESNLADRVVSRLQDRGGIVRLGGYTGWVRFLVSSGRKSRSARLWYSHGSGGGAPVTKGAIAFNRYAEYVDADIIASGHVHWKQHTPVKKLRLTDGGVQETTTMHYLRCGTYKDEFGEGLEGWHIERGGGPRPLGGWWLKFAKERNQIFGVTVEEAGE